MAEIIFYSNCVWYAWKKYKNQQGYLAIRRSRLGSWIPHFIWIKELNNAEIAHFVPERKIPVRVPPPWFKGYVKRNDDKEGEA